MTERVGVIARVRDLAVGIAKAWTDQQYGGTDKKSDKKDKAAESSSPVRPTKERLAPVGS